jgi:hypothetical protein
LEELARGACIHKEANIYGQENNDKE